MRKARIVVGLFVLWSGVPPLVNAMGSARVATLHGLGITGLLASGWCFGFGSALLVSRLIFRGE